MNAIAAIVAAAAALGWALGGTWAAVIPTFPCSGQERPPLFPLPQEEEGC